MLSWLATCDCFLWRSSWMWGKTKREQDLLLVWFMVTPLKHAIPTDKTKAAPATGFPLASSLNNPLWNKISNVPDPEQGFTCRRGLIVKLPAVGFMHDTYCTFVISFSDSLVLSYLWTKRKQQLGDCWSPDWLQCCNEAGGPTLHLAKAVSSLVLGHIGVLLSFWKSFSFNNL